MDEVILAKYDPRWPTLFAAEAARIQKALGNEPVVTIEHLGSTAVPGLAAKPIIDLMVGVYSLQKAQRYQALKLDLARRFRTDREAYTDGKSKYVQAIVDQELRR